ncbi:hypothetical protein ACFLQ0_05185 [Nitrospinota bacterium]
MANVNQRRQLGRDMTERISRLLSEKIPGVEHDIRFSYLDDSFRLWWGDRGDPESTLIITFEQIQTLTDEALKRLIRGAAENH